VAAAACVAGKSRSVRIGHAPLPALIAGPQHDIATIPTRLPRLCLAAHRLSPTGRHMVGLRRVRPELPN